MVHRHISGKIAKGIVNNACPRHFMCLQIWHEFLAVLIFPTWSEKCETPFTCLWGPFLLLRARTQDSGATSCLGLSFNMFLSQQLRLKNNNNNNWEKKFLFIYWREQNGWLRWSWEITTNWMQVRVTTFPTLGITVSGFCKFRPNFCLQRR